MTYRLHLARDGRSLGQRDASEIASALVSDELRSSDLSWCEGETAWIPLGQRPAFAGATAFRVTPEPALERWRSFGLLRAAALTLRETLLAPMSTFAALPASGSLWSPLLLHLLVACVANALGLLWAEWFIRPFWEHSVGLLLPMIPWGQAYRFFGWLALATPILVLVGSWIAPILLHLALRLLGGGKGSWTVTFRVTNYVGAATNLILAIPMLGALAFPWGGYCLLTGLASAHRDAGWKPVVALALTLSATCCLTLAAAILALMPFFAQLG